MGAARFIQGRTRNFSIALGVAIIAIVVAASPASALTSSKMYSLSISPAPVPAPSAAVPSGQDEQIQATITNETMTQQIGSFNLFPPSGTTSASNPAGRSFTLDASQPVTTTSGNGSIALSGCTNAGANAGQCVQVRNLTVAPGATVTVTFSVNTPACPSIDSLWAWSAEVKQSNNFSGSPGNDFAFDASTSQPNTELDGACSLKFVNQPADQLTSVNITSLEWDNSSPQAGQPVSVEVLSAPDPSTGKTTVISSSTAPIMLALGANNGGVTLTGGGPVSANGGVASFGGSPPLAINAPGSYTLAASSGTLGTDKSQGFDIATFDSACNAGSNCSATTSTANTTGQVTASVPSGGGNGFIAESANANNGAQITCLTSTGKPYTAASNDTYTYFTTDNFTSSKVVTVTVMNLNPGITGNNPNKILKSLQICYGAQAKFATAPGYQLTPTTLPGGLAGFIGVLADCGTVPAGNPCHDRGSDAVIPDPKRPQGVDYQLVADIPAGFPGDPAYHV